jgi:hypothetical protein
MIFQYFNIKTIWKHPNYLKALKKKVVHFNIFMIQIHFKKHFNNFIKQDLYQVIVAKLNTKLFLDAYKTEGKKKNWN